MQVWGRSLQPAVLGLLQDDWLLGHAVLVAAAALPKCFQYGSARLRVCLSRSRRLRLSSRGSGARGSGAGGLVRGAVRLRPPLRVPQTDLAPNPSTAHRAAGRLTALPATGQVVLQTAATRRVHARQEKLRRRRRRRLAVCAVRLLRARRLQANGAHRALKALHRRFHPGQPRSLRRRALCCISCGGGGYAAGQSARRRPSRRSARRDFMGFCWECFACR